MMLERPPVQGGRFFVLCPVLFQYANIPIESEQTAPGMSLMRHAGGSFAGTDAVEPHTVYFLLP